MLKFVSEIKKSIELSKEDNGIELTEDCVMLGCESVSKEEAIEACGNQLKEMGCCDQYYVKSMQEREKEASVYIGMGVAIPHGTSKAKNHVIQSGVVFRQYPDGIDFGDEKAYVLFGVAGKNDDHVDLLAKVSRQLAKPEVLEILKTTKNPKDVVEIFN